jgi:hypothetical protein
LTGKSACGSIPYNPYYAPRHQALSASRTTDSDDPREPLECLTSD